MMHLDLGQLGRQCCALGLLTSVGARLGRWRHVLQLLLNSSDAGINGFMERAGLGLIEVLAAASELPAYQDGYLVRELVNVSYSRHEGRRLESVSAMSASIRLRKGHCDRIRQRVRRRQLLTMAHPVRRDDLKNST